jgi:cell division protein FtsZ
MRESTGTPHGTLGQEDGKNGSIAAPDTEDLSIRTTETDSPSKRMKEAQMINLTVPQQAEPELKPCITVVGVGGAGGNAVNNMIADNLQGVDFVVANTDAQALSHATADRRLQLGQVTTQGLGAGAKPEVGRAAAEETCDQIAAEIQGANMVFITAGMGGGTGTGAAPVIARVAREMGILTVGVVTKPFQFEGQHRMRLAETGIEELSQYVDTLIIIPNQNLFRVANEKTTFADAFKMADDVLNAGVRSITDLMIMPGLINLDFADVRTVMSDRGRAMMGTGEASGERRALDAAEAAIANPLLEDTCMKGAGGVLINITGGPDITLFEVDEAANRIRDEVEGEAHIIFGSCFDPDLEGKMRVSVVATGISGSAAVLPRPQPAATPQAVAGSRPAAAQPAAPHAPAAPAAAITRPAPAQAPASVAPRPEAAEVPAVAAAAEEAIATQEAAADLEVEQQYLERHTGTGGSLPSHRPSLAEAAAQAAARRTVEDPRQGSLNIDLPQPPAGAYIPRPSVTRETPLGQVPERPAAFSAATQPVPPRPAPRVAHAGDPRPAPRGEARPGGFFKSLTAKLTGDGPTVSAAPTWSRGEAETEPTVDRHPAAEPHHAAPLAAHPEDRPPQSRAGEEDELEIPAFLRRQAN